MSYATLIRDIILYYYYYGHAKMWTAKAQISLRIRLNYFAENQQLYNDHVCVPTKLRGLLTHGWWWYTPINFSIDCNTKS